MCVYVCVRERGCVRVCVCERERRDIYTHTHTDRARERGRSGREGEREPLAGYPATTWDQDDI